jgi:hypothetical protein
MMYGTITSNLSFLYFNSSELDIEMADLAVSMYVIFYFARHTFSLCFVQVLISNLLRKKCYRSVTVRAVGELCAHILGFILYKSITQQCCPYALEGLPEACAVPTIEAVSRLL